jgi:universal stress protein A
MNSKRILIPVDLMRGSPDALVYVQRMAQENPLCVTLLHVVDLNIAPAMPSVYDQLCAEGEAALRKLAKLFFGADQAVRVIVRVGKAAEEIVAEAKAGVADMIILSAPKTSKQFRPFHHSTTRHVLGRAPCPTVVLPRPDKVTPHVYRPQSTMGSEEAFAEVGGEERAAAA